MEGRTIFMAKKKENVTEEIKVQESTVKAPVKKAAAPVKAQVSTRLHTLPHSAVSDIDYTSFFTTAT